MNQINVADAREVQRLTLEAVAALSRALELVQRTASPELAERLNKGFGLSIGKLETDVLSAIYSLHPDLDDLAK